MTPTPTTPDRPIQYGDFLTIGQALNASALQSTGINVHSLRGELTEALTYAALREQAVDLAGRFLALGLRPGDRVALAAESDGDFLRAFFACQYAGLVPAPVPLPAPLGGKEPYLAHIRRMMIAAGARAAFAPPALGEWFVQAAEGLAMLAVGSLADITVDGREALPAPDASGLCYLQFSSGSTRFPLGVAVTQKALMANVWATGGPSGLNVTEIDRTVTWLPLYHDMGLVGMVLTSMAFQVSIDLLPTGAFVRRPGLWLDLISSRRGSVTYAPTFGYDLATRRAGAAAHELDLSSWRVAGLGGDMIKAQPLRAFAAAYASAGFNPGAFVASYGMAETTLAMALTPVGDGLTTDIVDIERLERRNEAQPPADADTRTREFSLCGRPLEGHALQVRDATGKLLSDRLVGRVYAFGPSLMTAYFGEPEATADVLDAEGWLDTGDLGYMLAGQLVITGRAKDLIIINGRNVWPQDLEWSAEHEMPGLRSGDVAVFSNLGDAEQVIALVQCRTRDEALREALRKDVGNLLRSRHGLEVAVVLVPPHSLPQTSSGKLSRSKSKALYLSGVFTPAPVAELA